MWAVIDIGSNTIRLVIYASQEGPPRPILNKKYAVGLAGYVDGDNLIKREGIEVLEEVLSDIRTILSYIKPEAVFPFGTATLRNSANGGEIAAMIKEKYGFDVRILSGEEEAKYDYYGALQDGIGDSGLLVDVGGGSTELTFFENREIIKATSIPLGSLNSYKKWVDGLVPAPKEAKRIKKAAERYLNEISVPSRGFSAQPLYSVGGTARAAFRLIGEKDGSENGGYTRAQLKDFLSAIENDQGRLLRGLLRVSPERVHTIIPGLLIFYAVAKHYGSESFVTIRCGVREGYLAHCLCEREQSHG